MFIISAITGKADFIVFDTDYDNYMAIFECNRAGLVHRRSVTVLSRSSTIDEMFIKRVRSFNSIIQSILFLNVIQKES